MADTCCGSSSAPASLDETVPSTLSAVPDGSSVTRLRIAQMDCPTEEALIRKKLGAMSEVHGLEFNLMQRVLTVVHRSGTVTEVQAAIRQ